MQQLAPNKRGIKRAGMASDSRAGFAIVGNAEGKPRLE
jgi:hypothetical protein